MGWLISLSGFGDGITILASGNKSDLQTNPDTNNGAFKNGLTIREIVLHTKEVQTYNFIKTVRRIADILLIETLLTILSELLLQR